MWWRRLKQRFPVEVAHKTFFRAVRSLVRMRRVTWRTFGGFLYLEKRSYYRVGDTIAITDEELKEILRDASRQDRRTWLQEALQEEYDEPIPGVVTYPVPVKNDGLSDHQWCPSDVSSAYPGNRG